MANKKIQSYEDKKFDRGDSLVSSLQQAFNDLKYDREKVKSWNMPVCNLEGVTMKILNNTELCLTYHRVEVGSIESMQSLKTGGIKFLKEVEKEIKSRFKKLTGKSLELKKQKEDQNFEQYGRLQADTGYKIRPIGKFFVKDTIHYEYSSDVSL